MFGASFLLDGDSSAGLDLGEAIGHRLASRRPVGVVDRLEWIALVYSFRSTLFEHLPNLE